VAGNPELASFLIGRRAQIEAVMTSRLGPAAPGPGSAETEVLRRFRSYAASALRHGAAAEPALDGLRANERRTAALLDAWAHSAAEVAGESGDLLAKELGPLLARFRTSLKQTGTGRRSKGAPRSRRRAVLAAIDRVSDAFLALDVDDGNIVDANPAAGALLGVARDTLLGVDALSFVPEPERATWWIELDAIAEGAEPRRFRTSVQDAAGNPISVDCSITRFARRDRPLALVVARPT
jgi:PAS domain S-box-containing protein